LQRAQVDITDEYVYVFGGGSDHPLFVFVMDAAVADVDADCCIAFRTVTAAFQLRPLSNVVMSVEQVTTSGDILSA
jgi:hypothetical protein